MDPVKLDSTALPAVATGYPIFHLDSQGRFETLLSDIYSRLGVMEGVMDTILADMVGEVTFAAAIAELNLAIGGVATEIGAASAATVAAVEALTVANGTGFAAVVAAIASLSTLMSTANTYLSQIDSGIGYQADLDRQALGFQSEETRNVIRSVRDEVVVVKDNTNNIDSSIGASNNLLTIVANALTIIRNTVNDISGKFDTTNGLLEDIKSSAFSSLQYLIALKQDFSTTTGATMFAVVEQIRSHAEYLGYVFTNVFSLPTTSLRVKAV